MCTRSTFLLVPCLQTSYRKTNPGGISQLMPSILSDVEIQWTTMATTSYQRLFKSISKAPTPAKDTGGPAAIPQDEDESAVVKPENDEEDCLKLHDEHMSRPLRFVFAPEIGALVNPTPASLVRRLMLSLGQRLC